MASVEVPKSVGIASRGIRTDRDAREFLSAIIGDVMTQEVHIRQANTAVNAMGKMLKLVEICQKYGDPESKRHLQLVGDDTPSIEVRRQQLLAELAELDK